MAGTFNWRIVLGAGGVSYRKGLIMDPAWLPRVKICCISSRHEADLAIRYGADALGLVGAMPSGPGVIEDDLGAEIARGVPPPVATFLLTSARSVDAIVAHHTRVRTSVIQIVDTIAGGTHAELRERLPGIKLVQVIHIISPAALEEAVAVAPGVDALLLDSGRPDMPVRELGGTGRTHDWTTSRRIREAVSIPVFLAGGLHADNVRQAIREVRPFGVDVCSGVRTEAKLDPSKLSAFVTAVRSFGITPTKGDADREA